MRLIGFDCAVDARNCGVAVGRVSEDGVIIEAVYARLPEADLLQCLAEQLSADKQALLGIDAPLGWPAPLGTELQGHTAGEGVAGAADRVFRREADRFIKAKTGKQPLDVAADRIARTAWAALQRLGQLRAQLGLSLPLAWDPRSLRDRACLEVYPAGTLQVRGLRASGYKGTGTQARDHRQDLTAQLKDVLAFSLQHESLMLQSDHALDAVLCVLAVRDFLSAEAMAPADLATAKKEGWIWVKAPPRAPKHSK